MQARCHGGHFRAVTPKRELCPPKRARIVPQKKATGPTPLGCICDQDLFVLFLVFTHKCEGKIRTKGGCAPKQEWVPKQKSCPKESNRTDATGVHFQRRLLFFFLVFFPNARAKSVSKVFVPPKRKSSRKESNRTDAMEMH